MAEEGGHVFFKDGMYNTGHYKEINGNTKENKYLQRLLLKKFLPVSKLQNDAFAPNFLDCFFHRIDTASATTARYMTHVVREV